MTYGGSIKERIDFMLDQSFSAESFRKILDYENRKGNYLIGSFFPLIEEKIKKIKCLDSKIREAKKEKTTTEFEELRIKYNLNIDILKAEKEQLIEEELHNISKTITTKIYKLKLYKQKDIKGKAIFSVGNSIENFLILKQLQYNFRKLYKVKQSSRFAIISQLKEILSDNFPKCVLRTDIDSFYESIPHNVILKKIKEDNLLSFYSKKIIFQIFKEYKTLSGSDIGLPRGIGISAYLAELYMRDFDSNIKSISTTSFYGRYVDDIIIVFTPKTLTENINYLNIIKEIAKKYSLKLNTTKTKFYDLINESKNFKMQYLGYEIEFGSKEIHFKLTKEKLNKYKIRIDSSINSYLYESKKDEKKARKLFVNKIKYLTSNTKLYNNKSNILTGIYYSNSFVSDPKYFKALDEYLLLKINTSLIPSQLKSRISKHKFVLGFTNKTFSNFSLKELSGIVKNLK